MGRYYDEIYEIEKEHADDIKQKNNEIDELTRALNIATCENGDLLKYKKAFYTIKDKGVNIQTLIHSKNVEEYNKNYCTAYNLTEQEYDFLKEVL